MSISFKTKRLSDMAELEQVVTLQEEVWGSVSVVPVSHLIASIHNGGILFGAIEEMSNKIVGFCYGFPGFHLTEGEYLYSHMLAIHPEYRNYGIGMRLKLAQREWALEYGYQLMKWTVDPLEMKNAHLNLCKLGGVSNTYIEEFYGRMKDKVNEGISSDRLLLEWRLNTNRVENAIQQKALSEPAWKNYEPLLTWEIEREIPRAKDVTKAGDAEGYLLAVPSDIQSLKRTETALVQEWRLKTRAVLVHAFELGYMLTGVIRTDDDRIHQYVLEKNKK